MSITYVGLSENWWIVDEDDGRPFFELPTKVETWQMKATHYEQFKSNFKEGTARNGGYILELRGKGSGMLPTVQLIIALPPDFIAYTLSTGRSQQTATKGRTVETSVVIRGAEEVEAQVVMGFIAPVHTFRYWASTKPSGPRFTTPPDSATPILRYVRTTVTAEAGYDKDGKPTTTEADIVTRSNVTKTYYGNAPAPISSALNMPAGGRITNHSAEPVPGTPWYRCEDEITWGFWGDD
jgi:hypothetical protein